MDLHLKTESAKSYGNETHFQAESEFKEANNKTFINSWKTDLTQTISGKFINDRRLAKSCSSLNQLPETTFTSIEVNGIKRGKKKRSLAFSGIHQSAVVCTTSDTVLSYTEGKSCSAINIAMVDHISRDSQLLDSEPGVHDQHDTTNKSSFSNKPTCQNQSESRTYAFPASQLAEQRLFARLMKEVNDDGTDPLNCVTKQLGAVERGSNAQPGKGFDSPNSPPSSLVNKTIIGKLLKTRRNRRHSPIVYKKTRKKRMIDFMNRCRYDIIHAQGERFQTERKNGHHLDECGHELAWSVQLSQKHAADYRKKDKSKWKHAHSKKSGACTEVWQTGEPLHKNDLRLLNNGRKRNKCQTDSSLLTKHGSEKIEHVSRDQSESPLRGIVRDFKRKNEDAQDTDPTKKKSSEIMPKPKVCGLELQTMTHQAEINQCTARPYGDDSEIHVDYGILNSSVYTVNETHRADTEDLQSVHKDITEDKTAPGGRGKTIDERQRSFSQKNNPVQEAHCTHVKKRAETLDEFLENYVLPAKVLRKPCSDYRVNDKELILSAAQSGSAQLDPSSAETIKHSKINQTMDTSQSEFPIDPTIDDLQMLQITEEKEQNTLGTNSSQSVTCSFDVLNGKNVPTRTPLPFLRELRGTHRLKSHNDKKNKSAIVQPEVTPLVCTRMFTLNTCLDEFDKQTAETETKISLPLIDELKNVLRKRQGHYEDTNLGHQQNIFAGVFNVENRSDYIQKHAVTKNTANVSVNQLDLEESRKAVLSDAIHEAMEDTKQFSPQPIRQPRDKTSVSHQEVVVTDSVSKPDTNFGSIDVTANSYNQTCRRAGTHYTGVDRGDSSHDALSRLKSYVDVPGFSSDHKCCQTYKEADDKAAQNDQVNYVHETLDITEIDACSCNVSRRDSKELKYVNDSKSSTPATHKKQFDKSLKSSLSLIEDRQIKTVEHKTIGRNKTNQSLFNFPIITNKTLSKTERLECTPDASLDFGSSNSQTVQSPCFQFEASHLPSTLSFADEISHYNTVPSLELTSAWPPSLLQFAPNLQTETSIQCSIIDNKNDSDSNLIQSSLKNTTECMLSSTMASNNAVCGQESGTQWSTEPRDEVCETFSCSEARKEAQKHDGNCFHHISSNRFDDEKEKLRFSKKKRKRGFVADLVNKLQTISLGKINANDVIKHSKCPSAFDIGDHQKQMPFSDSAVEHTQQPNMANTEMSNLVSVVPNNTTETILQCNMSVIEASDHSFKSVGLEEKPCMKCLSRAQSQEMALPLQNEKSEFLSGDSSKLSLNTAFSTSPRQTPEKSLVAETSDTRTIQDEEANRSTTIKKVVLCGKDLSRSNNLSLDVSSAFVDRESSVFANEESMPHENRDGEQFHKTLDTENTGSACAMPLQLHAPSVHENETYWSADSHTYFESISKDAMELTSLNLEAMSEKNEQAIHSSDLSLTSRDVSTSERYKNRQYRDIGQISHWISSIFLHNKELYVPNGESENSSRTVLGENGKSSNNTTTKIKKLDSCLSTQTNRFPAEICARNKCNAGINCESQTWEEEKDCEINTGFKQNSRTVNLRTERMKQRHSPVSTFEAIPTETQATHKVNFKDLKDNAINDTGIQTSCSEASFVSVKSVGEFPVVDQFPPLARQLENGKKMLVTNNEDNVREEDGTVLNQDKKARDSQELVKIQPHSVRKRPKLSDPAKQMLLKSYKLIGGFVQVVIDNKESGTPVFVSEVQKCLDSCVFSENDRESVNNLDTTLMATKTNVKDSTENTENGSSDLNRMARKHTCNVENEILSTGQVIAIKETVTNDPSFGKPNSEQSSQPSEDKSKNQMSLSDASVMANNKNKLTPLIRKTKTNSLKEKSELDINYVERDLLKEDSKLRPSNMPQRQIADASVSNISKQWQTTKSVPHSTHLFMSEQTLHGPLLSEDVFRLDMTPYRPVIEASAQTGHVRLQIPSASSLKGVPISDMTEMTQSDDMLIKQRQLIFERPSAINQYFSGHAFGYLHRHQSPRSNGVLKNIEDNKESVESQYQSRLGVKCLTEKQHTNENYSTDEEVACITHSIQCRPSTSQKKTDSETYNRGINSQETSWGNIVSKHPTPYLFPSINILCEDNHGQVFSEYSASCSFDSSREQHTEMKRDQMSLQDQSSHGESFLREENKRRKGDIVSSTKLGNVATDTNKQHHDTQHHNAKHEYESLSSISEFPEAQGPVMEERFQTCRRSITRNEANDREPLSESKKPTDLNTQNGPGNHQSTVQNKDESRFFPHLAQSTDSGNLTPRSTNNGGNSYVESDNMQKIWRDNICYLLSLLEKVQYSLQKMVNKIENRKADSIPKKSNKISFLPSNFKNKGGVGTEDEDMKKALKTLLGSTLQNVHKLRAQIASPLLLSSESNENTSFNDNDLVTPVHQRKANCTPAMLGTGEEAEIGICSREFAIDETPDYVTPHPKDNVFVNEGENILRNMTKDIKTNDIFKKFKIFRYDNSKNADFIGKIEIMCRFLQISANSVTDDNFVDRMYKTLTEKNASSGCMCESSKTQEHDRVGKECTGIGPNEDGRMGVFPSAKASFTYAEDGNGQTAFQPNRYSGDTFTSSSLQYGMTVDKENEDLKQCKSHGLRECNIQNEIDITENICKTVQVTSALVTGGKDGTNRTADPKSVNDWYVVDDVMPQVFNCVLPSSGKVLPTRSFEDLFEETSSVDQKANDPPPSGISMYTIKKHLDWHIVPSVAASKDIKEVAHGSKTSVLNTGEDKQNKKTHPLQINDYDLTKRKKIVLKKISIKPSGSHPYNQNPNMLVNNSSSFDSYPTAAHPKSKERNTFAKHKPVVYTMGPKDKRTDLKTSVSTEEMHFIDKHRHNKQSSDASHLLKNDAEKQPAAHSKRSYTQSASSVDLVQQTGFLPPGKTAHQSAFRIARKENSCSVRGAKGYALVKQGTMSTWTEPVYIDGHVSSSSRETYHHPNNNSNQRRHQLTPHTQIKDIFSNFNMNGSPEKYTETSSHKVNLFQSRKDHGIDSETSGSSSQSFVVSPLDEANAVYVSLCVVSETVDPITGHSLLKVTGTGTSASERELNSVSNLSRQQQICKPIDKRTKATVLSQSRRQQSRLSTNQNASNTTPGNIAANQTGHTRSPLEISAPVSVTVLPNQPNDLASDPRKTPSSSKKEKLNRTDNSKLAFSTGRPTLPARARSAMFSPDCENRECMSVRDKINFFTTKLINHLKPGTCRNQVPIISNAERTVKDMCKIYQHMTDKQFNREVRKYEIASCSSSTIADHSHHLDHVFKRNTCFLESEDSDCFLNESAECHCCPSSDSFGKNNRCGLDNYQQLESKIQTSLSKQRKECDDNVSTVGTPSACEVAICDCGNSFSNVASTKSLNSTRGCGEKTANNVDSTHLLNEESNDIESQRFSVISVKNVFEGLRSFRQNENGITEQSSFYSIGNTDSSTSSGESWITAKQDYATQCRSCKSSNNGQHETKVQSTCSNTDVNKKAKQSACRVYPVPISDTSSQNNPLNAVNICSYSETLEELGKHKTLTEKFADVQDRCGMANLSCTEGTNTINASHSWNASRYYHVTDWHRYNSGQRPCLLSGAKYSNYYATLVHHDTQTESYKMKSKQSRENPSYQQDKNEIVLSKSMLDVSALPKLTLPTCVSNVAKKFLIPAKSAQKIPNLCDKHLQASAELRTDKKTLHRMETFHQNQKINDEFVATNKNATDEKSCQTDARSLVGEAIRTSPVKKRYIPKLLAEKHHFQQTNNSIIMTKCDEERRVSTLFEKDQKLTEREFQTQDIDMPEDTSIVKQNNTTLEAHKLAGRNPQELETVPDSAPQRTQIKENNTLRNLYKITIGLQAEADVKNDSVSRNKHVSLTVGSINVSTNAKGHSTDDYQQRLTGQEQASYCVGNGMSPISVATDNSQGNRYCLRRYNRYWSASEKRSSHSFHEDKVNGKQTVPQHSVLCKPDNKNKQGTRSNVSDNMVSVIKHPHLLYELGTGNKTHNVSSSCDTLASPVGIILESSPVFRLESNKKQEYNDLVLTDMSSNLGVIKTTASPQYSFKVSEKVRSRIYSEKEIESYMPGGGENISNSDETIATLSSASRQEYVGKDINFSASDSGCSKTDQVTCNMSYISSRRQEMDDKERQPQNTIYVNDNATDEVNVGRLDFVGAKYFSTKSDQVLKSGSPCKSIQDNSVHYRHVADNSSLHSLTVPKHKRKEADDKKQISDKHGQIIAGHIEFAAMDRKDNQKEGKPMDHDQESFETEHRNCVQQVPKKEKKCKHKYWKERNEYKRVQYKEQSLPVAKIELTKSQTDTHCSTKTTTVVHGSPRYHKGDCFYDTTEKQGDVSFVPPIAHYVSEEKEQKCDTQQIIKKKAANLATHILNQCVNVAMTTLGVKQARVCHTDKHTGDHISRAHHHTNPAYTKENQLENNSRKALPCAHCLQHTMPGVVCRSKKLFQSQDRKTEIRQRRKHIIGTVESPNDKNKTSKAVKHIYPTKTDRKEIPTSFKGSSNRKTGEFEREQLFRRNLCLSTKFKHNKHNSMGKLRSLTPSNEYDKIHRHRLRKRDTKETDMCNANTCVPAAESQGVVSEELLLKSSCSCEEKANMEKKHDCLPISGVDPVSKVFQNCQHRTDKHHVNFSDGKNFSGQCHNKCVPPVILNESVFARAANDLYPPRKWKPAQNAHLIVKHSPHCYKQQSAVRSLSSDFHQIFQQAYSKLCPHDKHSLSKTGKNNCNSVRHNQSRQRVPSDFCSGSMSDSSLDVRACCSVSLNNKRCNIHPSRHQRLRENNGKFNSRLWGIKKHIITGSKGNEVAHFPCNKAKQGSRKDKHFNYTRFHRECLLRSNNEHEDKNSNTKTTKLRIVAEPSLSKDIPPSIKIELSSPSVLSTSPSVTRVIKLDETMHPDPSAKLTFTKSKSKKGQKGTATLQHSFPKCALKDSTRMCSSSSQIPLSSSCSVSLDDRTQIIGTTSQQTLKINKHPSDGNVSEFKVRTKSPNKPHPSSPKTYCVDAIIKSKHKSPTYCLHQKDTCIKTILSSDTSGQHLEKSYKKTAYPSKSAASVYSITNATSKQNQQCKNSIHTSLQTCKTTSTTSLCVPSTYIGQTKDECKRNDLVCIKIQESNGQSISQMEKKNQSHRKQNPSYQQRPVGSAVMSSDSAMSIMSTALTNLKHELPDRKRAPKKARTGIKNFRLAKKSNSSVVSIISGNSNMGDGENQLKTIHNLCSKKNTRVKRVSRPDKSSTKRLRGARRILKAQKKLSRKAYKAQKLLNDAIQATRQEIIAEKKMSRQKHLLVALKVAQQKRLKSRPSVQCVTYQHPGLSSTSFESTVHRVESSSPHRRSSVTSEGHTCSCLSVSLKPPEFLSPTETLNQTGTCVSVVSKDNHSCCFCSGRTSRPPLLRKGPVVDMVCSSCVQVPARHQDIKPSKKYIYINSWHTQKSMKLNGKNHCIPRKCISSQSVLEAWDVHREGSNHGCQSSKSDSSVSYMLSETGSTSGARSRHDTLTVMRNNPSRTPSSNDKAKRSLILQTHKQYLNNLQQIAERLASSAVKNADRHIPEDVTCRTQLDPCYLLTLKDMSKMVAAVCMTATERGIAKRWRSFCSLILKPEKKVSLTTRRNTANNSSPFGQDSCTVFYKVSDRPVVLTNRSSHRTLRKENVMENNKARSPEEKPMAFTETGRENCRITGIQTACANRKNNSSVRRHITTAIQTRDQDGTKGRLAEFNVSSPTSESSCNVDDSSKETGLQNKAVKSFDLPLTPRISDTTSFESCPKGTMFHFKQPQGNISQGTFLSESIIIPKDHRTIARFGHRCNNHTNLQTPLKSQGHRCHQILRTAKIGQPPHSKSRLVADLPKTTTYKSCCFLHQSGLRSECHDVIRSDFPPFCSSLSKQSLSLQRQKRRDAKIFMSTLPDDAQKSLRRRQQQRDGLQRDASERQPRINQLLEQLDIYPRTHLNTLKESHSLISQSFPNQENKIKRRKESYEIHAEENFSGRNVKKSMRHSKKRALAKNEVWMPSHCVQDSFCYNCKDVDKTRHTDVSLQGINNHADHFKPGIETVIDTLLPCARGQDDSSQSQEHRSNVVRDCSHHIHAHRENKREKCGLEDCRHSHRNKVACNWQDAGQLDKRRCHCASQQQPDSRKELSCLEKSIGVVNQHEPQGESSTYLHYVFPDNHLASERKESRQRYPLCSNNKTSLVIHSNKESDTAPGDWRAACGHLQEGTPQAGSACGDKSSKPNYSSSRGCRFDNAGSTLPSTSRAEQHVSSSLRLKNEVRQCVERNMRRLCKNCPLDMACMSYQNLLRVNGNVLNKLQTASRWDADSVNRVFRDVVYQCYLHYHQPDLCFLSNNSSSHFSKSEHHLCRN